MLLSELTITDSLLSSQKCLGVNAAFLQEIKSDNDFLDELLLATRDALTNVDSDRLNVRTLLELLRRLRDRLAMHFSVEEAFGYVDDAIDFPTAFSLEAEALRRQHSSIYLEVCEIVESVEQLFYRESPRSADRIVRRTSFSFACLYSRLLQHDKREHDLVDSVLAWQRCFEATSPPELSCPGGD